MGPGGGTRSENERKWTAWEWPENGAVKLVIPSYEPQGYLTETHFDYKTENCHIHTFLDEHSLFHLSVYQMFSQMVTYDEHVNMIQLSMYIHDFWGCY